jgi:hypothetical protein
MTTLSVLVGCLAVAALIYAWLSARARHETKHPIGWVVIIVALAVAVALIGL